MRGILIIKCQYDNGFKTLFAKHPIICFKSTHHTSKSIGLALGGGCPIGIIWEHTNVSQQ